MMTATNDYLADMTTEELMDLKVVLDLPTSYRIPSVEYFVILERNNAIDAELDRRSTPSPALAEVQSDFDGFLAGLTPNA